MTNTNEAENVFMHKPKPMTYADEQQRILDTLARLRAERLAREASNQH